MEADQNPSQKPTENAPETTLKPVAKPKGKHGGARRGAGRSAVPVETKRTKVVAICCTAAEHALIARSAEDRGITMSEYCLRRSLGQKLPPVIPTLD